MKSNLAQYCFAILLIICLWSCNKNEVYYKFIPISQSKWDKSNKVCFNVDSINMNPGKIYNIDIELSHNLSYEYETLWLYIDQTLQDSISVRDTLECLLTDKNGKWLGRGNGPLRHISFSYKKEIALDTEKQSQICIVHAMQDLQLKGVEKIGLKIY